MRRPIAIALMVSVLLAGGAASAAPSPHQQALDLYDQGRAAYNEGRFDESVNLLTKAYQLEKVPVLLYNLARAYEALSDFDKAAATYDQYLKEAGDIPDRAAIEARVANLRKTIAEKAKLAQERDEALKTKPADDAAKPRPGTGEPETNSRSPNPAPWIIAGLGLAGVGVGAGLGGAALSKNATAKEAPSQQQAASEHDSAKTLALGSTIGFIAGGVVLAGGLTWGIIDVVTRKSPKAPVTASIELRPLGAAATIRF